ncbi:alpha-soluble NSF attachment protein, partial [Copidosoma floridanum]|uniref:alpha-soluble NSF attachment protein n=1 Tax=Copidosoma floridanum TaxID=29053 RepID=UPI000C6F4CAC
ENLGPVQSATATWKVIWYVDWSQLTEEAGQFLRAQRQASWKCTVTLRKKDECTEQINRATEEVLQTREKVQEAYRAVVGQGINSHTTDVQIIQGQLTDTNKYLTEHITISTFGDHEEEIQKMKKFEEEAGKIKEEGLTIVADWITGMDKVSNMYLLQVAIASLESSLLKYSAKEYYLRAALCHLCVDVLNAQHAIERYQEQCPSFQDARECKFIKMLIEQLEEQNLDSFTEAVKEFDTVSRLDQWFTTMLLRIKKQINDNPDLR